MVCDFFFLKQHRKRQVASKMTYKMQTNHGTDHDHDHGTGGKDNFENLIGLTAKACKICP